MYDDTLELICIGVFSTLMGLAMLILVLTYAFNYPSEQCAITESELAEYAMINELLDE